MITCTRRLQFCAGHRVLRHEGKCAHMHGHNYVVLITCQAAALDDIGRVIDFGVIKERIGTWIDAAWDHGFLVYEHDREVLEVLQRLNQKHYVTPFNPTAENIAEYLLREVCPKFLRELEVEAVEVRVWETENCYAEARL